MRVCLAQSFSKDQGSGSFAKIAKGQQPIVLLLENEHYICNAPSAGDSVPSTPSVHNLSVVKLTVRLIGICLLKMVLVGKLVKP